MGYALRGHRWVVLHREEGYEDDTTIDDYLMLTHSQSYGNHNDQDDPLPQDVTRPIILVLRPVDAQKRPLLGGKPISGSHRWKGTADASLGVIVVEENGAARLNIETRDDVRIPVPPKASDKAFLGADHVELWFCERCPANDAPGDGSKAFQLGIGERGDGSLDVRWLWPDGVDRPLPKVRGTLARLQVEVPDWALPKDHQGHSAEMLRLAFAYSDSDTKNGRQEKLIALQPFEFGKPETFTGASQLVDVARYPEAGGFVLMP
jgi:hypothetical protein